MSKDTSMFRCEVNIDLELIEKSFALLMGRLREQVGATFTIDRDFYWAVGPDEVFDAVTTPTMSQGLGLGRLTDELEWLANMMAKEGEHALPYDFVLLGGVLTAIGRRAEADFREPRNES